MAQARRLVVTGATGKQGGALISALLSKPSQPFEIYAVTRNSKSASAQRLAGEPHVHVIEGDFDQPAAIFNQVPHPWGLFSVTTLNKGVEIEEQQGKAMTAAALAAGVEHIVFSATDRGGPVKSDENPTYVPHFISKYNVERDIRERAGKSKQGTTWTFLRPVAFYDNFTDPLCRANGMDRNLQMIGTKDIGRVAAEAFLNAESDEYCNQAMSLAGDEISPAEMDAIFRETYGREVPASYAFVGSLDKLISKDVRLMFEWFEKEGFGADVKMIKERYPFMQDFRTWLKEETAGFQW